MADGGFRGTTIEQDSRFADKQKKLLKSIKFPASFSQKVDLAKVNLSVIKPWIHKKVIELLGIEDELLINYIFEMLEDPKKKIDPKDLQISLTEFLAKDTPVFVKALWDLLLSAQESVGGIPKVFLEEKMKEVAKLEEEKKKMADEIRKRVSASVPVSVNSGSGSGGAIVNPERERLIDDRSGSNSRDGGRDDRREYSSSSSRAYDYGSRSRDDRRDNYRRDYNRSSDYDRGSRGSDRRNDDRDRDLRDGGRDRRMEYPDRRGREDGYRGDRDREEHQWKKSEKEEERRTDGFGRDRTSHREEYDGDRSVENNRDRSEAGESRLENPKRERDFTDNDSEPNDKEEGVDRDRDRKKSKKHKKHKHKKSSKSNRHDGSDHDAKSRTPSPSKGNLV
ncbi:hypothetical protein BDR26DRAFT_1009330 [Obelidium mucronatum]|nr:hypothetical protein BDR26DRAFT_1009330 [Obelidium mucronatum]